MKSCITCAPGHVRVADLDICLQQCPESYYERKCFYNILLALCSSFFKQWFHSALEHCFTEIRLCF